MKELILQIVIGLALIIIGIFNMNGNVKMLHSYHIKRVKKEDIKPFGKLVGIGSIIIGLSIIIAGIFTFFNHVITSNIIITAGLVIGSIFIFYALFKYNKGIF